MSKICSLYFCIFLVAVRGLAVGQSISESQVFEWWDSGIVNAEEAQEMLDLIQEGNQEEACFLAEIYAMETCENQGDGVAEAGSLEGGSSKVGASGNGSSGRKNLAKKSASKRTEKAASKKIRGRFSWKGQADSLGALSKKRYNLQLDFYRLSLRLGTQNLLVYRHKGAEAFFGQISTKELGSSVPLDTLWGAAMFYPMGRFTLGALLDTAGSVRGFLGYSFDKTVSANAVYWHSPTQQSAAVYGKSGWGEITLWSIIERCGLHWPLLKVQLHGRERQAGRIFSWRTTAYYHGDSVPEQARLSKTLQKYRFWGAQSFSFAGAERGNTKITASTRVAMPLDGDTASAKLKLQGESGPRFLRISAGATCQDAENGCSASDYKLQARWQFFDGDGLGGAFLQGSVRSEYRRGDGLQLPKLEVGAAYSQGSLNQVSLTLIAPRGNVVEKFQVRNQVSMGTERLQANLGVTFSRSRGEELKAVRGYIQVRGAF
ncbi:MAG: hypothetical protein HUK19_09955 [Fibrobacter sp.]|nr:hypothetical protein [Fibrobacter sp.]